MEILFKKKNSEFDCDLTQYTFGAKKVGFFKSLFIKKKPFDSSWIDLIECYFPLFKNGTIEIFLEIKHPLGSFNDFEKEFQDFLKNNPIYYQNEKKFIVIRNLKLETLKELVVNYYDQGLVILMSKKRLSVDITDQLIKQINLNVFSLNQSIKKGFDIAIEFNFPSGKEVYISTNLEEDYVEKCFDS